MGAEHAVLDECRSKQCDLDLISLGPSVCHLFGDCTSRCSLGCLDITMLKLKDISVIWILI
jgi:hypothetical protein